MGGLEPEYKQFRVPTEAIYAFYANGARPHKHWLFRISLIWQVGT